MNRAKRRGAILVVVLALLTMFAIIAISFLFLAVAEADIARLHKEAAAGRGGGPPAAPNPEGLVNQALGYIVFDAPDTDLLNAIRGHSLARSMYGWHGGSPFTNLTPYSGIGTFHEQAAPNTTGASYLDSARWVNYSGIYPKFTTAGFFMRDPEWSGVRDNTQVSVMPWAITMPAAKSFIPKNAPYTYPDLKDFYLAQLSPATGEVLTPSFVRPWSFTMVPRILVSGVPTGNADWLTARGRVMTHRPRPVDQLTPAELQAEIGVPTLPPVLNPGQEAALIKYIDQKIQNGELIPYPGQNADGTYTGDHQLLTGGVGTQRNDSILVDVGLPVQEWPPNSGKLIKPLVAMLIYDLDGFLDLNSHGNTRNGGAHTSYQGWGRWEVNLSRNDLLGIEASSIVNNRMGPGGPFSRNNRTSLPFDLSGLRLPQYSVVNWDGTGTPPASPNPTIQLPQFGGPTPNPFFVRPLFGGAGFFDDNVYDNPPMPPPPADPINKYLGHPGLFNPSDWGSPAAGTPPPMPNTPFTYPLTDLKRLRYKYADVLSTYQETALGKMTGAPNTTLIGTFPANDSYRLDPAHAKRMLFATLVANLDRPGWMPNFFSTAAPPPFLQLGPPADPRLPNHPTNTSSTGSFAINPSSAAPTNAPDFNSITDWRNPRAALGPIDLNRQLSDYRTDPNTPLGQPSTTVPTDTSNMGNNNQAAADRQNMARDIFARLIIATGANATVYTQPTPVGMVTYLPGDVYVDPTLQTSNPAQFNALRYLAQIAVNIVDDLDPDDVSTTFVWAPTDGGMPAGNAGLTPVNSTNLPTFLTANMTSSTEIRNRVVFGVERSRLVINEAYGELTNGDEAFMATGPTLNARVRFWVELMNPTTPPYYAGTGPLGSGAVTLYNASAPTPYSPYRLQIATGAAAATDLADPSNVVGEITTAPPQITFDFSTAAAAQQTVPPVNGGYSPPNGNPGFVVVGPPNFTNIHLDAGGNPIEFRPDTANPPFNQMIVGTPPAAMSTTAMEYDFGSMPTSAALQTDAATNPLINLRRNTILLQRLANPYLPPGPTNPYITVDKMDWVPAFDAVARTTDAPGPGANRTAKGAPNITTAGFEAATMAPGRRYAVGRVQPYAGFADGIPYTAGNNTFPTIAAFPNSMVVQQNPATPAPQGPLHTFFRMNGQNDGSMAQPPPNANTYQPGAMPNTPPSLTDTLMAPFDWFVHFDRPIINPLELMQVQAVKPHEVTQYFIVPPPPAPSSWQSVRRGLGQVPWFGVQGAMGVPGLPICDANTGFPIFDLDSTRNPTASTNNGLFRALEMLRVKSWTYGEAHGGRTRGQVNLNTIQDIRILKAMLDARPPQNNFSDAQVDALWTNFIMSSGGRTFNSLTKTQADGTTSWIVPVAGKTIDDADPSDSTYATQLPNLDRPIKPFGVGEYAPGAAGTYAAASGTGIQDTILRMGANGYPRLATPGQGHPYLRDEMVRKLFNNSTTVSNVFAVHMMIVYHEVRSDPATGGPMTVNEGLGTRYLLGKEAFREAPGDMRPSFFAVIDRTQLMVTPGGGPLVARPFYSAVEQIVPIQPPPAAGMPTHKLYLSNATFNPGPPPQLTVYCDGRPTALSMASGPFNLVVGVGTNQEIVTVSSIDPIDGSLHIGGAIPLTKPHYRGELVANGLPGNPGPIGTPLTPNPNNPGPFDVLTNPISNYKAIVPYIVQTE